MGIEVHQLCPVSMRSDCTCQFVSLKETGVLLLCCHELLFVGSTADMTIDANLSASS